MPDPGDPGEPYTQQPNNRPQTRWNLHSRALPTVPAADSHNPIQLNAMDAALAGVRAELPRVDNKAGSLLALMGALLVAVLTVLGTGKLTGLAAVAGWSAAAQFGAAVLLLAAAIQPRLGGDFGFCLWAQLPGAQAVLDAVAAGIGDRHLETARQLHWLSRSLVGKYRLTSHAVHLLVGGMVAGVLTAALALWIR